MRRGLPSTTPETVIVPSLASYVRSRLVTSPWTSTSSMVIRQWRFVESCPDIYRSILSAARRFLARGLLLCAIVGRQLLRQFEIVVDQNVGGNARYPRILQQDFNRRLTIASFPERDAGVVVVGSQIQMAQ